MKEAEFRNIHSCTEYKQSQLCRNWQKLGRHFFKCAESFSNWKITISRKRNAYKKLKRKETLNNYYLEILIFRARLLNIIHTHSSLMSYENFKNYLKTSKNYVNNVKGDEIIQNQYENY